MTDTQSEQSDYESEGDAGPVVEDDFLENLFNHAEEAQSDAEAQNEEPPADESDGDTGAVFEDDNVTPMDEEENVSEKKARKAQRKAEKKAKKAEKKLSKAKKRKLQKEESVEEQACNYIVKYFVDGKEKIADSNLLTCDQPSKKREIEKKEQVSFAEAASMVAKFNNNAYRFIYIRDNITIKSSRKDQVLNEWQKNKNIQSSELVKLIHGSFVTLSITLSLHRTTQGRGSKDVILPYIQTTVMEGNKVLQIYERTPFFPMNKSSLTLAAEHVLEYGEKAFKNVRPLNKNFSALKIVNLKKTWVPLEDSLPNFFRNKKWEINMTGVTIEVIHTPEFDDTSLRFTNEDEDSEEGSAEVVPKKRKMSDSESEDDFE